MGRVLRRTFCGTTQPGEPTLHVITRAFKNTPVPITFPMITEIAATSPRPRTSEPLSMFCAAMRIADILREKVSNHENTRFEFRPQAAMLESTQP